MKSLRIVALLSLVFLWSACVPESGPEESATEAFRMGLLDRGDIEMNYGNQQLQGLAMASAQPLGHHSVLAYETGRSVVGTNLILLHLVVTMEVIASLPPTVAEEDLHIWEGVHEGVFSRVTITREDRPEGARFDYLLEALPEGESGELRRMIEGYTLRFQEGNQLSYHGYGLVDYDFDEINEIYPQGIGGTAAVAFRRAGGVHQVNVRFVDAFSPEHPDFPPLASYQYIQRSDLSGEFAWMSSADYLEDGEPYEDITARVRWNADLSGTGIARLTGGSMEVDYWHLTDCWNDGLQVLYNELALPNLSWDDGDIDACAFDPAEFTLPTEEELGSERPEVPQAHPEEQ